jgi:hypothetical protein
VVSKTDLDVATLIERRPRLAPQSSISSEATIDGRVDPVGRSGPRMLQLSARDIAEGIR